MNNEIFKEWFFECFIPGVMKYLKSRDLPIKAVFLIGSAPTHLTANELVKGYITVKFLPPNVSAGAANGAEGSQELQESSQIANAKSTGRR